MCTECPVQAHEACLLHTLLPGLHGPPESPGERADPGPQQRCALSCALWEGATWLHMVTPDRISHLGPDPPFYAPLCFLPGLNDLPDSSVHFWLCQFSGLSFFYRLHYLWEDFLFSVPTPASLPPPHSPPPHLLHLPLCQCVRIR